MAKTEWSAVTSRTSLVLAGAVAVPWLLYAGGCTMVRDGVAMLTGAPTSKDYATAEHQLDEAERRAGEADQQVRQLELAVERMHGQAEAAEQRKAQLRQVLAEAAQRMASMQGQAADAMLTVIGQVQAELRTAAGEVQEIAAVVGQYEQRIAEHQAAAAQARGDIDLAEAQLLGLDEQATRAVSSAVGGAAWVGEVVQSFGVPGAGAAGAQASEWMAGGLGLLGIGGGVGGQILARRRRKQADEQRERADTWEKVIATTEKHNLIRDDESANGAKDAARKELGRDALVALKELTARVRAEAEVAA